MNIVFKTHGIRTYLSHLGIDDDDAKAKAKAIDVSFELNLSGDEPWLKVLEGGVTGYESISIRDLLRHEDWSNGWSCCAGTKGRWDSLRINADDMISLQKFFARYTPALKPKPQPVPKPAEVS